MHFFLALALHHLGSMILDELQCALPPPEPPPHRPSSEAWLGVFAQVGSRLPSDYVAFVERYGAGEIDEFLRISTPFQAGDDNLLRLVPSVLGTQREMRIDFPDDADDFPLWFEVNGFLPFGSTANGETLFWVTSPRIDFWTVAVFGRGARAPERFEQFPDDWPSARPAFLPMSDDALVAR